MIAWPIVQQVRAMPAVPSAPGGTKPVVLAMRGRQEGPGHSTAPGAIQAGATRNVAPAVVAAAAMAVLAGFDMASLRAARRHTNGSVIE
jgi:hypothetical protein